MTAQSPDLRNLLEQAKQRADMLGWTADLFDQMAGALSPVADRKYQDYEAEPSNLAMRMTRTANDARDEYRRVAKDNRVDAEIYGALLTQLEALEGIARDCIVAAGGVANPGVSLDFLRLAPAEVKGRLEALEKERDEAREILGAVFSKQDKGIGEGAPGHSHYVLGIWDRDNKAGVAGTKCEWCATWDRARATLKEQSDV